MEAESIFPVFGPLHADDSPAVAAPCEKHARKVYAAGLYVVSADRDETCSDEPEQESESILLKVTGDISHDSISALYSLAYLSAFFSALEPSDLRQLADELGVRR